jgi:hypothetical protein
MHEAVDELQGVGNEIDKPTPREVVGQRIARGPCCREEDAVRCAGQSRLRHCFTHIRACTASKDH